MAWRQVHSFVLREQTSPHGDYRTVWTHSKFSQSVGLAFLDRTVLSNELGKFFKRLDRKVYKRAATRYGKRLRRFCVIEGEGGDGKRLHAHILIEWPRDRMSDKYKSPWWSFQNLVASEWRKSPWAEYNFKYDPGPDEMATLVYLEKEGREAIDWPNTYL